MTLESRCELARSKRDVVSLHPACVRFPELRPALVRNAPGRTAARVSADGFHPQPPQQLDMRQIRCCRVLWCGDDPVVPNPLASVPRNWSRAHGLPPSGDTFDIATPHILAPGSHDVVVQDD